MTCDDAPALKAIQIMTIPKSYRNQSVTDGRTPNSPQKSRYLRFERFLGGVLHFKWPFAYRMRASSGKASLAFVGSFVSSMKAVESSFLAHFRDFSLCGSYPDTSSEGPTAFAIIFGVPKISPDSLNGLAEAMIQSKMDSMYQVLAVPKKPSKTKRFLTKKRLKSASTRSQTQESQSGFLGGQEIRTRINPDAARRLKRYQEEFERMSAARVLDCQVVLVFWGSSDCEIELKNAVSILMASISSTDRDEQLRVRFLGGEKAERAFAQALNLEYRSKSTQLLPSEAAPLFHIPTIELAIEPASPASFSTSGTENRNPLELSEDLPYRQGEISVGSPHRSGTLDTESVKSLTLNDLKYHAFIGGKTGTGKSTTKNRIIIDAWNNRIPSLILEPVKTDARALMGAISELRLFTMGRENVAPFRMNPFYIEEDVSPKLHMGHLHSCFMAAWPVYGMLANHMRRTLKATYENNGWDLVDEMRGIPITLDIFLNEAEMYSLRHIGYGTELSQDFTGAIIARAEDLCDTDRAVIFNTTHDLTMSELMSKPTIIEMDGIGDPEFTCFSLSLILVRVIEHLKKLGPTSKLRCLLMIDEAHRVLEEMAKPHDEHEAASAKYKATELLVNLISEARSYGLGIVLVEQIPTRLARNAIKNCHTKIIHKLTSPDDVDLMAAETGCDKEQKAHITALKTGEAVIADPRSIVPANIQVFYDPDYYPDMKRNWTDDDVRGRMKLFYEAHPGFAMRPEIPVLMPHRLPLADSSTIQIDDVVQTPTFRKLWGEAVAIDEADSSHDRLAWLIASYAYNLGHIYGTPEQTAQVLLEVAIGEYGAPPNPPDMTLIRQLIAEMRRRKPDDVRRGRRAP